LLDSQPAGVLMLAIEREAQEGSRVAH